MIEITAVCENAVYGQPGLLAEHGWSAWVDTGRGKLLWDCGQGMALESNARKLGLDLSEAKAILLSHHHYDHTGGLLAALRLSAGRSGRPMPVLAHPGLFRRDSFSVRKGKEPSPSFMPFTREELEAAGAEFDLSSEWRSVAEGVHLTGEVPRETDYETGDSALMRRLPDGSLERDPVTDDQSLVIEDGDGLAVVLGCSHSGIVNILRHISRKTGKSRFKAVLGGTHLGPLSQSVATKCIDALLEEFDIELLGVSHCTGPKVASRLAQRFGRRFTFFNAGCSVKT